LGAASSAPTGNGRGFGFLAYLKDTFLNLYDLDTPALIVDLTRLERNIARMAALAREGGKQLRPHIKTHKTPEIAQMQLASGAVGLTVAKLGEAEVFADAGFTDLFMANEVVGAAKVERLIALLKRVKLSIGVDSVDAAAPLSDAGFKAGVDVLVRIEIDTGLGRAGVRTVEDAVELAKTLSTMKGLRLEGIFTHEGTSYRADAAERASNCAAAANKIRTVRERLAEIGLNVEIVSVGSTPGAPYMALEHGMTEIRPGNYVFSDTMQMQFGTAEQDCALSILTTVISRPDADTAILDSGTKSLSGDRALEGSKHGQLIDHPEVPFDWASEEHGHLDLRGSSYNPRIGEKARVIPYHACACTNMHDVMYAVRDEKVEATWKVTARGRIR
jgi:D-serine deaminase-like pyridoxal phosphate-dependent protein